MTTWIFSGGSKTTSQGGFVPTVGAPIYKGAHTHNKDKSSAKMRWMRISDNRHLEAGAHNLIESGKHRGLKSTVRN
jgi:hypothetical protein